MSIIYCLLLNATSQTLAWSALRISGKVGLVRLSQALQTPEKFHIATQQRPANLAGSMETGDSETERLRDTITVLQHNQALQTPQPECRFSEEVASSQSTDVTIQCQVELWPAREERYQCCDQSQVKDLHKSISEYDLEIWETIKQFGDIKDRDIIENPLNSWNSFDNRMSIIAGQQWFEVEGEITNLSQSHLPITASLRRMQNTLRISPRFKALSFSQVHTGFISWFVFDVLGNKIDLYDLPRMKLMRVIPDDIFVVSHSKRLVTISALLRRYSPSPPPRSPSAQVTISPTIRLCRPYESCQLYTTLFRGTNSAPRGPK